jgi:cytochrome c peroxidase
LRLDFDIQVNSRPDYLGGIMKTKSIATAGALAIAMLAPLPPVSAADTAEAGGNPQFLPDAAGAIENYSSNGKILTSGAFFQSLGTNGRSCATCHIASEAFGLSAAGAKMRYFLSGGRDPLFASIDGANCAQSPANRPESHSLLLQSGLIRIPLQFPPVPPVEPQFTISVIHDPYGCAISPDPSTGQPDVSVYRRPLPSTNLSFLSAIMADGRETIEPLTSESTFRANLITDLTHQAVDATLGHAQANQAPTASQLADIVQFELGLYSAQGIDLRAGSLDRRGANGGAVNAAALPYYPGINDSLGADPTGASFNPNSMSLYAAWGTLTVNDDFDFFQAERNEARREIAAGEVLFNSTPITITNVRGLNDNAALGKPTSFVGHCTTCHDTPNVGNHSLPLPLDIGTSHSALPGLESDPAIVAALAQLSLPNLPVYLINGCPNPFNEGQPASFYTTDPGKALITGNCSDLNRVKGPILRGLAARAPYFHNGAAATLLQVVNFYNQRFQMNLTDEEKHALVAFLNTL